MMIIYEFPKAILNGFEKKKLSVLQKVSEERKGRIESKQRKHQIGWYEGRWKKEFMFISYPIKLYPCARYVID